MPPIRILVISGATMQLQAATGVSEATVRIILAGHLPAVMEGFKSFLSRIPGCNVVLCVRDGEQLLQQLPAALPLNIAILDVHNPSACAFRTIAHLREHHPGILPVALSLDGDEASILRANKAGARGHLLKTDGPAELSRAVDQLMTTGRYQTDFVYKCLMDNPDGITSKERACVKAAAVLTPRQLEVMRTLFTVKEPTVREAAETLNMSPRTLEAHLRDIFPKVGVKTRGGLILWAMEYNFLDPGVPPPTAAGY